MSNQNPQDELKKHISALSRAVIGYYERQNNTTSATLVAAEQALQEFVLQAPTSKETERPASAVQGFSHWFGEQHGPRKSKLLQRTDEELRIQVQVGKRAEAELRSRDIWDEKRQSALYAWTAALARK